MCVLCDVKYKVKSLPVTRHAGTDGVEFKLLSFLTSFLDGDEWLTLLPGCFTPGKKTLVPVIQEAGWTPRAGLGGYEEEKVFRPHWIWNPELFSP
jgi:hypothetical protein